MAIFASSTFTVPSNIDLALYTPEVGGAFIDHPAAAYTTPFQVDPTLDTIFSIGTAAYYVDTAPPSADYYAQADFLLITAISQNIAVCARMDTTADTMYFGRLNNGVAWQLFRRVTATALQLGSDSTTNLPTAGGAPVAGRIVCAGDQISFVAGGVTVIGPITDTSITAAGRAGVRNSGAASATTGAHLDNFSAGDLEVVSSVIPYFSGGHSPYRRITRVSSY